MTNKTRQEIVRMARKGRPADEITRYLRATPIVSQEYTSADVQRVIDEETDKVDAANRQARQQDSDPVGRIAKWLTDARAAGYTDREMAEMLVEGTALGVHIRGRNSDRVDVATRLADQLDAMAEEQETTGPTDQPKCPICGEYRHKARTAVLMAKRIMNGPSPSLRLCRERGHETMGVWHTRFGCEDGSGWRQDGQPDMSR